MNKTLRALLTQLECQRNALNQQLLAIEQQLLNLEQKCQESQQKISNSCTIPAIILPEQEMARLHFILREQQYQDDWSGQKTALHAQKAVLKSRQIRLNTELKLLEHYQDQQLKQTQRQALLTQQNKSDEWVVQRRDIA